MAIVVGFQKNVSLNVNAGLPGDLGSARTMVTLAANGLFALGDVIVGNAGFYAPSGNQVVSASADGTTAVAGFVLRNSGLAPMGWTDSQKGYGFIVPDGTQASLGINGDFLAIITGIDANGAANHVPFIGEKIWVKLLDGSIACAPSSVATATGYVATNWIVTKVGLLTQATVGTNQSFGQFSGQL